MSDYINFDGLYGKAGDYLIHPYSYRQWRPGTGTELPSSGRIAQLVPAYVLNDHDYSRRTSDSATSTRSSLPRKTSRYQFLQGHLTQDELNAAARAYSSPLLTEPWRNFDDASVKFGYIDPEVDAMYRYVQQESRLLEAAGSRLVRSDIDRIRREAGESTWSEAAERLRVAQ